MFKDKIAEALRTKYGRFGLSNEAIDRIASAREKTVTKEEDVDGDVNGADTMYLVLEESQRMRDREIQTRTDLQKSYDEYKKAHPEGNPDPKKEPDPNPDPNNPDIAKIVADAVAKAVAPMTEKIAALETSRTAEQAVAAAKESFFSGDYVKKYKDEAAEAWERAVEINTVTGNKMDAKALADKASSYFNAAVGKKGVDTSKPFKADPEPDKKGRVDWKGEVKRLQDKGTLPKPAAK